MPCSPAACARTCIVCPCSSVRSTGWPYERRRPAANPASSSAPHLRHLKEAACGCAGVFGAPAALAAYLKVFEEERALDKFESFASLNGPAFYDLPANEERVTLEKRPNLVCDEVGVGKLGEIHPLFGGDQVDWSLTPAS